MRGDERMVGGERIGGEDEAIDRIIGSWIDGIEGKRDKDDDQRVHPSILRGEVSPAAEVGPGFAAFVKGAGDPALGVALE